MGVAQDLRSFLLADATISETVDDSRVHRNIAPESYVGPYIWYRLATTSTAETLQGSVEQAEDTPFYTTFDVEVYAKDIDDVDTLAGRLRAKHHYIGAIGGGTCQAVRVVDQGEDYIPSGLPTLEEDLHGATIQLRIDGYTTT